MLTPAMTRLVEGVTQVVDSATDPRSGAFIDPSSGPGTVAGEIASHLRRALPAGAGLLSERLCLPDPQRYCQHVAYVDPAGRFSIVSLVWLPGQATPIHDHACWCVVGVVLGREEESRYSVVGGDRPVLRHRELAHNDAGSVCWLVPPADGPGTETDPGGRPAQESAANDIHQVRAVADGVTVSLHVYGDDITARGTSIRRVYPESMLEAPGSAHPAPDSPADGAASAAGVSVGAAG